MAELLGSDQPSDEPATLYSSRIITLTKSGDRALVSWCMNAPMLDRWMSRGLPKGVETRVEVDLSYVPADGCVGPTQLRMQSLGMQQQQQQQQQQEAA